MNSRWRRFEILLPLQFNDGRFGLRWLDTALWRRWDKLLKSLSSIGLKRRQAAEIQSGVEPPQSKLFHAAVGAAIAKFLLNRSSTRRQASAAASAS
jgi:hypothetical protein